MISMVVAYDKNRLIGCDNKIPWSIPDEMKWFKSLTENSTVVMGRKTWDSLPKKPLKNRTNIIISKSNCGDYKHKDVIIYRSIDDFLLDVIKYKNIFVIGGATIYKQFLSKNVVDDNWASEINEEFVGDTYFPEIGKNWCSCLIMANKDFNVIQYIKQKE